MWNMIKAERWKELLSASCWMNLKEEDREKLLSLYGQGLLKNQEPLTSPKEDFAVIVSDNGRDLFILCFTIDSKEAAYCSVCLPEDFSLEEDLPEELSEELFDYLDRMEQEKEFVLLMEANSEKEAWFWEEVGLQELESYYWMKSKRDRNRTELCHHKEYPDEKQKEETKEENTDHNITRIRLQKTSPADPVFQETLSITFEEPKEVFVRQISDLSQKQMESSEALFVHADGKTVGLAFLLPYENGYQLTYFGIFPKFRNQGYGTRAFSRILTEYSPLFLSVKTASPAMRIYERSGMEKSGYFGLFSLGE